MRVRAEFNSAAAVHFDPVQFIESPAYGVARFMLDRIGDEKARATTIVRYQPNSKFPEHTHIGGEEFVVLEGTFKDQFGEFKAGTYVRNPIDSVHEPWVDEDGCTIMVKLLQMADTGEGTTPLHIDLVQAEERADPTGFGRSLTLYRNDLTGELVQSYWVSADAPIPTDEAAAGGEELFVLEGEVMLAGETFKRWDWLRFPPGESQASEEGKRATLKAGAQGAHVYRKTGHLTPDALAKEKIQIVEAQPGTGA